MALSQPIVAPVSNRRVKMVYIASDLVVAMMSGINCRLPDGRRLRTLGTDVPEFCDVDNVTWDHSRGCFAVLIRHKSFPEIPHGDRVGLLRGPVMQIEGARWRFLLSARVKIRSWLRSWRFARTAE
jgi:hypothetical protein